MMCFIAKYCVANVGTVAATEVNARLRHRLCAFIAF